MELIEIFTSNHSLTLRSSKCRPTVKCVKTALDIRDDRDFKTFNPNSGIWQLVSLMLCCVE